MSKVGGPLKHVVLLVGFPKTHQSEGYPQKPTPKFMGAKFKNLVLYPTNVSGFCGWNPPLWKPLAGLRTGTRTECKQVATLALTHGDIFTAVGDNLLVAYQNTFSTPPTKKFWRRTIWPEEFGRHGMGILLGCNLTWRTRKQQVNQFGCAAAVIFAIHDCHHHFYC